MDIMETMKSRHSVRQYTSAPIPQEVKSELNALVAQINSESGLHIQILYDEEKCFNSFMAHYGKFSGVKNYIALVGKKSPSLDEKLGYYGEKLVLKAQELGLNTCWVALTHGKSMATVDAGEKHGCIISLGYGENAGVPHASKPLEQLGNCTSDSPEWFVKGVEAAALAPTAMNQQKFYFQLNPDGTISAKSGSGFYTKVDLGIAKLHFELVTGKEIG